MKAHYVFYLLFSVFVINSCTTQRASSDSAAVIKPEKNQEGEWEILVFDTQYDYFLNAIAKPQSMYNEQVLKARNQALVSEWNSYYYAGRYRNVIESAIEYDPNENYGLEFEYRLYQVFAFVQWKYGLRLRALSGAEVR